MPASDEVGGSYERRKIAEGRLHRGDQRTVLLVCLVLRARQRAVAGTRGDIEVVAIRTVGLGGCSSPVPHVRFGFISRPVCAAGPKIRVLTRVRRPEMALRRGPRSGGWAR